MRKIASVDANQREIVCALRACGCDVQPLHQLGGGVPDLLVGLRGKNFLLEVKDGNKAPSKQRLTPDEYEWHKSWRGHVVVVASVEEARRAVGL